MPSFVHEVLVLLLESRPALAVELLRDVFKLAVPEHSSIDNVSDTVRSPKPVELHADRVLILRRAGVAVLAIVAEVQGSWDEDKVWSWPCYVAIVRRQYRCPCVLLTLAFDDATARRLAAPIAVGPGGFALQPLVLGRESVPRIVEDAVAAQDVELAVLAAIAHGEHDAPERSAQQAYVALKALATAAPHLDSDRKGIYADCIQLALSTAAKAALEDLMNKGDYEIRSEFFLDRLAKGREEGLEQGRQEGLTQGLTQGRIEGEVAALLAILDARGLGLDDVQAARIRGCSDLALLGRWLRRAATALSTADVFDDG